MLGVSEYTKKYLGEYLTNYEKLKFYSFINGINFIASTQNHAIAVTKYSDDYVILNNSTGNIDFFEKTFFIDDAQLQRVIAKFNDNRSEQTQMFTVKDDGQKDLFIIARQEWFGAPDPIYIFTSFRENQLFYLNTLTNSGSLAVFYEDKLVASSGALNPTELADALDKRSKHSNFVFYDQDSNVSGFRYVYITEPQKIVTPALIMIIASGLLALIGSIGLMTIITKRMYNPIQGVLRTTGNAFTSGDEFVHIGNTIQTLHSNVQTMSQSLEKYKVSLESKFLHDLLTGLIPSDQLEEELQLYPQLHIEGPFIAVLLKYTETVPYSGELSSDLTQDTKQLLLKSLEGQLVHNRLFKIVDMSYETKVIILGAEDVDSLSELLKNTIISVEPEYGLDIKAVMSPICETLSALPAAYRQTIKIVETAGFLTSNAKIIRSEDVKSTWKGAAYYPLQLEQSLINAIIQCKTAIWHSVLEEIIRTNQLERSATLPSLSLMLEATVTRIIDSSSGDSLISLGESERMNVQFQSCGTYEELHQKALETFGSLDDWFTKESEKSSTVLAEKMLTYIHENYKEDISLFNLADYLNLSRNYVSTLFKNTVGRNFKDYLGEYRHQIACHIMSEHPKKKIKEVAEMVGCNTEILTRLFARYSGMSPSDYQQRLDSPVK